MHCAVLAELSDTSYALLPRKRPVLTSAMPYALLLPGRRHVRGCEQADGDGQPRYQPTRLLCAARY
eukprot:1805446-Rhodomonas_salina.5